ncbi:class I SAM-dependent methyltransferase [Maridesulfovibrio hydrothermalis]|uniref:Methyltransferase type 11 n=1 Tax=Maridesulfovibrio hydrothermalis AM13 = DSM 14728 TaxID=1121451 RepID=L0R9X8_9BACT|nr:class I SAM-dependent methyltransferase [Maridesulfovibrio hydrothermalis]CCO22980.1 Methyltransferase type 11 [Maridesulfovibrio hydrothermalis AM13 = DSM 14728]
MVWDGFDAEKFDEWFKTPAGRFALEQEVNLMDHLISGWPRRKRKLLEVGCGTGLFLEHLYRCGFDISGVDHSPVMLEAARKRLGKRASLYLCNGEILPFDDNEFDFTVLWTVLEFCSDPDAMLSEAARVSAGGVLVGFLNRHSIYFLTHGKMWTWASESTLRKAKWFSPSEMSRAIKEGTGYKPVVTRSVLPGPMWSWKKQVPWKQLNGFVYPPYVGAFTGCRVDFSNRRPLNPLHAWKHMPSAVSSAKRKALKQECFRDTE